MKLEQNPELVWDSGLNRRRILVWRLSGPGASLRLRTEHEDLFFDEDALTGLLQYLRTGVP